MGIRCTNNVIQTVTGRIARGYNRNKSLPVLLASGCVLSFKFMSKTRFCAVGIEPSTRRTKRQMGSSGRDPRAAKAPTMAMEAIGIRMSLTNPTVPNTLLSTGSRGRTARNHCKDFLRPSASPTLCGAPTKPTLASGTHSSVMACAKWQEVQRLLHLSFTIRRGRDVRLLFQACNGMASWFVH